jgi:hypothetical protein
MTLSLHQAALAPPGALDVGPAPLLALLGRTAVVRHSRISDDRAPGALRTPAAAFRGGASKR